MKIRFRPHHFLCTLGFQGKGYNLPFVENFSKIANHLRSSNGLKTEIEITWLTDSICTPCPNRDGATCLTDDKIQKLDQAHTDTLKLNDVHSITWEDALNKISNHMTLDRFHQICEPCEWKSLGVCEKALIELKSNAKSDS